ncbi:S8 family serine peptidase [Fulvivirgaceae bacterium BMA10]|uniref:S8 family serine peptidase n=1 Tax=Splendidivirga corallicola TaxID=3051826 RepID=A0ABT8KPF7_9BACT|nr:S8 family serine peptidase [Fulvivirgaceae bacterium BMA10]
MKFLLQMFCRRERGPFSAKWIISALLVLCTVSLNAQSRKIFSLPEGITENDYQPGVIIMKLREYHGKNIPSKNAEELGAIVGAKKCHKAFPNIHNTIQGRASASKHGLSNIYKIQLGKDENIVDKINQLLKYREVIYAEPYYKIKPLYIPNDPGSILPGGQQNYLTTINAYAAWDIQKGDSNIVVGVLDTGIDLDHEDLTDNIKLNYDDPINGIDDDADGYIDNYYGWDMADHNNDPGADLDEHGTSVSGVMGAKTNNGTGIAGLGFNSKILPVKIFTSLTNSFNNGYEAILYAAEQGCQVINLSWGSDDSYSDFAKDIIDFVVEEMDVVVIAAAGNTNAELNFYPASYSNVLSVGASDNQDRKASFATYSKYIDLIAPGSSEYTTANNSGYKFASGSSFASPMVAGVAALVRAEFPELNARQVMQKIRSAAHNIYDDPANQVYNEMLGRGRLDAYRALLISSDPAPRMTDFNYDNGVGSYVFYDDTLSIDVDVTNFLNKTHNGLVTLSSSSPYVTVVDSTFDISNMTQLESRSNNTSPFKVYLHPDLPTDENLIFRLGYEDINYTDYQYFDFKSDPEFINFDNQKFVLTIDSDGGLGYTSAPYNPSGIGLEYEGSELIDHTGLIIADDNNNLLSNVVTDFSFNTQDQDFTTIEKLKFYNNSTVTLDARSSFDDSNAGSDQIGLRIEQKVLANEVENDNGYIIIEYRITNTSGTTLNNLKAGIFADWDLNSSTTNKADWDSPNNLGYVYDAINNNLYGGLALISAQSGIYTAIDLNSENGNTANFSGDFTKTEKHDFLVNGNNKLSAGANGNGNEVAHIVGGNIISLENNQSVKVTFAFMVGESLSALQAELTKAQNSYHNYLNNPTITDFVNICHDSPATINPANGTNFRFYQDPDTTVFLHNGETYTTAALTESTSYYAVNIDEAYKGDIQQLRVVIKEPQADFAFDKDTVYLDESNENQVSFTDLSIEGTNWFWDFKNGFTSTNQNPTIQFPDTGVFDVKMKVTSKTGCLDSANHTIVVLSRGPKPNISNFKICEGESINITATNASNLSAYSEENLGTALQEGNSLTLGPFFSDTTFYVTNLDSTYESLAQQVLIDVDNLNPTFTFYLDSLDLNEKDVLHIDGIANNASQWEWFVNNSPAGNNESLTRSISLEETLDIKLITTGAYGCRDSVSQVIEVKKSPQPLEETFRFCLGDEVNISPSGGNLFYFYDDEERTQILHKGHSYQLSDLQASKSFYITNVDSLLESDVTPVHVSLIKKFADFSIGPDTLNISEGTTVTFRNESPNAIESTWLFEDGSTENASEFTKEFEFPAIYNVKLTTRNDIGCVDSLEKKLVVVNITGIDLLEETPYSIFPNPTNGKLTIEYDRLSNQPMTIKIYNHAGQLKMSKEVDSHRLKRHELNLEDFPKGIYLLRLSFQDYHIDERIILN